jgi:hypothetical protein
VFIFNFSMCFCNSGVGSKSVKLKQHGKVPYGPKRIRPDPDIGAQISVVVHKLNEPSCLGYSVHATDDYAPVPGSTTAGGEGMWFWLNKYPNPERPGFLVDLENFTRGEGKLKKKGGVLYRAILSGDPTFEKFFRVAGRGTASEAYGGFFGGESCPVYGDAHYLAHPRHHNKRKEGAKDLVSSRPNFTLDMALYPRLILCSRLK